MSSRCHTLRVSSSAKIRCFALPAPLHRHSAAGDGLVLGAFGNVVCVDRDVDIPAVEFGDGAQPGRVVAPMTTIFTVSGYLFVRTVIGAR
jgi:hypothetical protein